MKPITDRKVAIDLPERDCYKVIDHMEPNGTIMHEIVFRDLVAVDRDDSAIIAFRDKDGKIKTVGYDSDGAYKTTL